MVFVLDVFCFSFFVVVILFVIVLECLVRIVVMCGRVICDRMM